VYLKNGKRVAVLMSGGLDSCVLTAVLAREAERVYPVYVRQGLHWEKIERHWLHRFLQELNSANLEPIKEIELPVADIYNSHWSTTGKDTPDHHSADREVYLPGRNLLLLAKTSLYCALNGIPIVALGPLSGNPFPDSTPEFFRKFQEIVGLGLNFPFHIQTPFSKLSKTDVIRLGKDLPLHLSFSCISPAGRNHCGACNKCAERRKSFKEAGVEDRTRYRTLPELV
jgi:7-cyano-7-deazaguanine synthase